MIMSDQVRSRLVMKGISAAAAASVFALVQGCATQPAQSQATSGYAQADSGATDSAATDSAPAGKEHAGHDAHHHKDNPYFRTVTSTTPGSVTVEGKTIHYHAVAGLLI